jgi:hypothetical protein
MGCGKKYLIWSNEHRAWWGANRWAFAERIEDAGRYDREEALNLCLGGMPGPLMMCPTASARGRSGCDVPKGRHRKHKDDTDPAQRQNRHFQSVRLRHQA